MTKRKAATVNSPDTNSNAACGSNTSLLRKIKDMFLRRPDAVPERISAGSSSSSVSPSEQIIQTPKISMPPGTWALPDMLNTDTHSANSLHAYKIGPSVSQTSTTASEITNSPMENNPPTSIEPITSVDTLDTPRREYFFYAYQLSENGMWFSTMLGRSPQEAKESLSYIKFPIHQKKLCCVML